MVSCSSDDDSFNENNEDPIEDPDPEPDPDPEATTFFISGSLEELEVGEEITFTIVDDLEVDRTQEAVISINNTPIEGNVYLASEVGEYIATASIEGLETTSSFSFTVTEATNFRSHDFEQTLVVFEGYFNGDFEGLPVDGFMYVVVSYDGVSILQNPNAPQFSDDVLAYVVITQENENGEAYLPGESPETEMLLNLFALKENGGEDTEYNDHFEEGDYSISFENVVVTSPVGGNGKYELNLIFDEFSEYTATFNGDFVFFDVSDQGGNPEERPSLEEYNLSLEDIQKIKRLLSF